MPNKVAYHQYYWGQTR